jgi:hypothetical protein
MPQVPSGSIISCRTHRTLDRAASEDGCGSTTACLRLGINISYRRMVKLLSGDGVWREPPFLEHSRAGGPGDSRIQPGCFSALPPEPVFGITPVHDPEDENHPVPI